MEKIMKEHKFIIYIITYIIFVFFISDCDFKLIYPLIFLLLITSIEFKKSEYNKEKTEINSKFILNLSSSIFFSFSIYILLFSIAVLVNNDSGYAKMNLDFSFQNILIVTIAYPILEELFFRKLFIINYNKLSTFKLVFLNGFFFSIAHFFSDVPLINAFLFGCCFIVIYLKHKKIIFSILAHVFINSLLFLTYFIREDIVFFILEYTLYVFLISLITSFIFFYKYLEKELKRTQ